MINQIKTVAETGSYLKAIGLFLTWIVGVGGAAGTVLSAFLLFFGSQLGFVTKQDLEELTADFHVSIDQITNNIENISRQVELLGVPEDIAAYIDGPVTVDAECKIGEPCLVTALVERHFITTKCKIIGAELHLTDSNTRRHIARPYRDPALTPGIRNVGASPVVVNPAFQIPRSAAPGAATGIIISSYRDCPWQIDGEPPVTDPSPRFSLILVE